MVPLERLEQVDQLAPVVEIDVVRQGVLSVNVGRAQEIICDKLAEYERI